MGGKSSYSKGFSCFNNKDTKALRQYGTKETAGELWCAIIKLFTTHNSLFTKSLAFTLAETLVVMGIIGVVAALTLPNLNSSTGDKEKVAKMQKLYTNLSDAYGRATVAYGPIATWSGGNSDLSQRFMERMQDFLKVSKYCGVTNQDTCHLYKGGGKNNSMPTMILADGSSMLFSGGNCSLLSTTDVLSYCGTLQVDIDGPNKGKNKLGYDQFDFTVTKEQGIIPRGYESAGFSTTWCFTWYDVCTAWVIENGNMDYLKAASNGKCKNSNVTLNATVTSCK